MTKSKILLAILPFWTPLIPPQGISRLKGFLQTNGFHVKTIDLNIEDKFKNLHEKYLNTLQKYIPGNKLGNLYNIGNDVWRDHMMAHINHEDKEQYIRLVKILIYNIFYYNLSENQLEELEETLAEFYDVLEKYFLGVLEREKPGVVGLSVHRDTLPASIFVFRLIKRKYPGIMTVMGGTVFNSHLPLNSPNMDLFLEKTKDDIDKIIIGEGEIIFLKLLQGELPGSQRLFTNKDIDGKTPGFLPIDMLDFSDLNLDHYSYMAAQGSKSCPNHCSFCNVAQMYGEYRTKDPVQTVEEMIYLHRQYNRRLFYMTDAMVNDIMTDMAQEMIRKNLSLYWDGYFRVPQSCSGEMALLWRRGGFYRARIGIESGSQRILDLMNKGITVKQIRESVTHLASAGIKTTLYIVVGYPGETEEDFRQSLDLIRELKNDIWEAECNPFHYCYTGQSKGDEWASQRILLYPPWAKEMLITQTWILSKDHSREEMFRRICRFVELSRSLGTAVPWSVPGVIQADRRWQKLHKNSVPPTFQLIDKNRYTDENRYAEELIPAKITQNEGEEFEF